MNNNDNDRFIYDSVSNFQVLQRDKHTNRAYVRVNGQVVEYEIGGPYTILDCHDIFVGDIWVMAGQSNMRGHGYLIDRFQQPPSQHRIQTLNVHLFNSQEHWQIAKDPTHRLISSPRSVHHTIPDPTVKHPELLDYRGASLGPSFAREYQILNSDVPVGLVASAHGGTSLTDWNRPDSINKETINTTLYGAMLDRIKQVGRVTGILWYQGESDTTTTQDGNTYYTRFQDWMSKLRQDVGQDMPFVFVQIGAHRVDKPEMVDAWMQIQDAQRRLFECHPNTAGVASLDAGLDDRVHLSAAGLDLVGKRLAIAAQKARQGQASTATPLPLSARLDFSRIQNTPPSIVIQFKHMESITWKNPIEQEIFGFEIDCEDKKVTILSARVEQDRKSIRLYLSDHTNASMSVRYGMNQRAINLIASNDMTLPAFKGIKIEI